MNCDVKKIALCIAAFRVAALWCTKASVSRKTLPSTPVLLSASGRTALTVPVSGSGSVTRHLGNVLNLYVLLLGLELYFWDVLDKVGQCQV